MNLKELKVVFAGCARDCSAYLPSTLDNIKAYSSLFKESFTLIIENGSKDKTKEILQQNQNQNNFCLFEDSLNKLPYRGQRLEKARNLIIKTIKANSILSNCDLFIMMDLDDTGAFKINNQDILNAINFLFSEKKIAGVFANQLGTYYDMWTLRDQRYCKNDFWVEVLQYLMKNKNSSEKITDANLEKVKKDIIDKMTYSFKRDASPILVESAFGGFGIYKMEYVLKNLNEYEGKQIVDVITKDQKKIKIKYQKCEHVNFNLGLVNQDLKLYILPNLINGDFSGCTFPPLASLDLIIKD
jgi:hypothetical protein